MAASNIRRDQYRGEIAKRMRQDSADEEQIVTCQKCDIIVHDKINCSGCKLSFCLKCAHVSETLYTCYTNGELDDFHWTCACCKSMFPTLDNIATTLQDLHLKSGSESSLPKTSHNYKGKREKKGLSKENNVNPNHQGQMIKATRQDQWRCRIESQAQ